VTVRPPSSSLPEPVASSGPLALSTQALPCRTQPPQHGPHVFRPGHSLAVRMDKALSSVPDAVRWARDAAQSRAD
jgi:hypothetical protein